MGKGFDEYAPAYDAWFLENRNVLYSEINLVAHVLKNPGRWGSSEIGKGKTVCLDYSSINIAKRFHIGHLSTTMIGQSLRLSLIHI